MPAHKEMLRISFEQKENYPSYKIEHEGGSEEQQKG